MIKTKELPPQELLKELFDYKDGQLVWKESRGNIKAGAIAGFINNCKRGGYRIIKVNKEKYKAHRLVYAWHNGNVSTHLQIDHINGIRTDNRIDNLRTVTNAENQWNTESNGFYWIDRLGKWAAQITCNGKQHYLGLFDLKEAAHEAYLNAKANLHTIENKL
jgi:hypothetical protein